MNTKIGYRLLAMLLAFCMVGNDPAVYAAGSADYGMQETVSTSKNETVDGTSSEETDSEEITQTQETTAEESAERSLEESVEESAERAEEETANDGMQGTTVEEGAEGSLEESVEESAEHAGAETANDEMPETVESSEEIETVTEEDVSENAGAYKISGAVTDITNKSATLSFELVGAKEGEEAFIKVHYFAEGKVEEITANTSLTKSYWEKFFMRDLYADMDYTVWAVMYADSAYTEELARTEELHFHTLSNEIHYKADVTFTDITNDSVTVNIALPEELSAVYSEAYPNGVSVCVKYNYGDSGNAYVSEYLYLSEYNGYADSCVLTNLFAGTEYDIIVIWPATKDNGKEFSKYSVTTSESRIGYNFSVEGDKIGEGFVHFEITSGYEENDEFEFYIYRADSNGNILCVDFSTLNAENHYTYESQRGMLDVWDVEYTIWGVLKQRDDNGILAVNVLTTDKIVKKAEKTKVFDLSVVEDSVTYVTAKIDVKWINTDYFESDEIEIQLADATAGISSQSITLKKGEKEQAVAAFLSLKPGKTYEFHINMELNNGWVDFSETVSFSTKACSFEAFNEVKTPSQEDIERKWKELGIDLNQKDTYEREVNHTDGGLLSGDTSQNATDLTNFIRYVVGLPADLVYDEEWSSICNAGSELNRLNGEMSHTPDKPEGVTEEFYKRGYKGTSNSNLAVGCSNLTDSILLYMHDPGEKNISKGHRNWILRPDLDITGFGKSGSFYSMYVVNTMYERDATFDKGYYHWPATYTPMEICSSYTDPSLYLSSEYDEMNKENIKIHVVSKTQGKEWTFIGEEGNYSDGCYSRIYDDYGGKWIVFGVGEPFHKGDEVTVTVTGTTINGVNAPITYTMNFFSVEDIGVPDIMAESISIVSEDTEVMENSSIQLKAQISPDNATNKKILWSVESADGKGQADITEDGVLTGKLEGLVKVTAACESDPTITTCVEIRVSEYKIPIESLVLSKTTLRMEKGDTGYVSVTLVPRNTTDNEVIFTSSAPEKVSVENGYIHALDVTQEPIAITVSAGSISSVCMVEVYENAEESMDKNYDTRITDIKMTGESNVCIGESGIIKLYPVTNGQHIDASEYEITVQCNEKFLSIESTTSEDYGYWYQMTGIKKGKQKITVKMTSKMKGNKNPETVTKNFTVAVNPKTEEETAEIATTPVLAKNNITINQNTVMGTALDIRLIEGNTDVTNVYLTSKADDGTEKLFSVILNKEEELFYIQTKEIGANKKYKLILHIDTKQGSWEYPITITTKKSFPTVSVKQTIKPNIQMLDEDAVLQITGKGRIENAVFKTDSTDFYQKSVDGEGTEYKLILGQSEHGKKLNKKGVVELSFEGYRAVYCKKITLATVSKKIKSHTLISDIKKVTLNSAQCGEIPATVKMSLKNSTGEYPVKIFAAGTNSKAKQLLQSGNIYFTYNKKTGALNVFAKSNTAKGTYKYKLTGCVLENGDIVNTTGTISLSVVVATKKPVLALKSTGSIDLIARSNSCVTYLPTVKNYGGRVASVELDGEDASKFYARIDSNGRIKIYVREKAMVYPGTKYNLNIRATLDNGYVCDDVGVSIKPKQSSFKAVAKQNTITLYKNEVNGQPISFSVKSPVASQIAYIKAVSVPEGIAYSSDSSTIKITNSRKVKAGKTYKITFEVTPKGAYRSIKPAKITIKVKVK